MSMMSTPQKSDLQDNLISLHNLSICFGIGDAAKTVVDGFSASIKAGEILALVGESGSGKTMVSRSILGLLPPGGAIGNGAIFFKGRDLTSVSEKEMQSIRGPEIGMVFQEPMTSLNPTLKIGFQMSEALKKHCGISDEECRHKSIEMLKRVRISDPEVCLDKYPHEFSGGMRQRILLASVLMMEPSLLIADEPTTALDVLAQKQVMDIMCEISKERGIAVLLITHDLGLVISKTADSVIVMCRGKLVEKGLITEVLLDPKEDYTSALMAALPARSCKTAQQDQTILCSAQNICVAYDGRRKWPWQALPVYKVLHNVSLTIHRGETLVVVGQSGSGKTTLAKVLLGLISPTSGTITYKNTDLGTASRDDMLAMRRSMQMVFQDPYSALDPRMSIGAIVMEGLRHTTGLTTAKRKQKALGMLTEVGLADSFFDRFPHELSGGQRQRVNIARALVSEPKFVVADEPVSALDLTVQKDILDLFVTLQGRYGFACLFITHDLSVAEHIADRVSVMHAGRIVEEGRRDQIFDRPCHPYTQSLLAAAPKLAPKSAGGYELKAFSSEKYVLPDGYSFGGWDAKEKSDGVFLEIEQEHFAACQRCG